jgi:SpoVK/Ycf46/Vps4 family AAA+-type ATPase
MGMTSETSIDIDSTQAEIHHIRGYRLFEKGDFNAAIEEFTKAIECDPSMEKAYYNRALAHAMKEDFASTEQDINVVLSLNPEFPSAHVILGLAYECQNRNGEALDQYVRELTKDPNEEETINRIDNLLAKIRAQVGEIRRQEKPVRKGRVRASITFEENEKERAVPVVSESDPDDRTMEDVALPEEADRYFKRLISIMRNKKLARSCGLRPPVGVLLSGGYGVGKTEAAHCIAGELKWNMVELHFAGIASKWAGQSENNLQKAFDLIFEEGYLPAVILVDEAESFTRAKTHNSTHHDTSFVNTFIDALNKMKKETGRSDFFLIATTNCAELIEGALIRPGRLDTVHIPMPDINARERILEIHLDRLPVRKDVDLAKLAKVTEGMSGAELAEVVNEAAFRIFEKRVGGLSRTRAKIDTEMLVDVVNKRARKRPLPAGYS